MSEDVLEAVRAALRDGESLVLVVVPSGRFRDLVPEALPDDSFSPDLSIEQYKAKHEPDLSLGRIRELCALGAFPDTRDEAGVITPGAYKTTGGEWRITLSGIIERQRQERLDGLRRRDREAERRKARRQAEDGEDSDSGANEQPPPDEAGCREPRPPAGDADSVPRPRKGKWKEAFGEGNDG